jgi:lipoprotein-releasing system permease protein
MTKRKFNHNINSDISLTYIFSKKRLTIVAALGVTIGIAIYIFLNSMMAGFGKFSDNIIFRNVADIRVYKDDVISTPLVSTTDANKINALINPKIVPENQTIINPEMIIELLSKQPDVKLVTAQVATGIFYHKGQSEFGGNTVGINIDDADKMFDIKSTMVEGKMEDLKSTPNGILLGVGVANKLSVKVGDNITISSPKNITKVMKVVGLFRTANSQIDKVKSFMNRAAAQQILLKNPSYVTDINVSLIDHNLAMKYSQRFTELTGYKAEDWQTANETFVSASKMRSVILGSVSFTVLIVAAFGIYNILSMTISQKLNDIAILKAMGFKGSDVTRIFVQQGLIIGALGVVVGLLLASILIWRVSKIYLGGDIGFFPIHFEWIVYLRGAVIGMVITFLAGLIPARKAANVDPVSILRK